MLSTFFPVLVYAVGEITGSRDHVPIPLLFVQTPNSVTPLDEILKDTEVLPNYSL